MIHSRPIVKVIYYLSVATLTLDFLDIERLCQGHVKLNVFWSHLTLLL